MLRKVYDFINFGWEECNRFRRIRAYANARHRQLGRSENQAGTDDLHR
jgi:hypothetical protein